MERWILDFRDALIRSIMFIVHLLANRDSADYSSLQVKEGHREYIGILVCNPYKDMMINNKQSALQDPRS